MTYELNQKLKALSPYVPVSESRDIIHLDANESFLNVSKEMLNNISDKIKTINFNRYPDPTANELCNAFSDFYGLDKNHVTAGNGSDELIYVLLSAFLMKGETVVTTNPDFSMYTFYPYITESKCITVDKIESGFVTPEELINKVKSTNAKMLMFSNPCNPTSLCLSKDDVKKIIKSVNALVVLDEAYMDFNEDNQSLLGEEGNYDNLIILKTCSKMGFAAARLGFAVTNNNLTGIIQSVKSPYNINTMTQVAGTEFLKNKKIINSSINEIIKSRNFLQIELDKIAKKNDKILKIEKSSTNFIYIRTDLAKTLHKSLLEMYHISVRLFSGALRITAGTMEENMALLNAIKKILK